MIRKRTRTLVAVLILTILFSLYAFFSKPGSSFRESARSKQRVHEVVHHLSREANGWKTSISRSTTNQDSKKDKIPRQRIQEELKVIPKSPLNNDQPLGDASTKSIGEGRGKFQLPATRKTSQAQDLKPKHALKPAGQGTLKQTRNDRTKPQGHTSTMASAEKVERNAGLKSSREVHGKAEEPPTSEINLDQQSPITAGPRERYLIYLCDDTVSCFGLGDRQRALLSTYYLAELTGRRFGLSMTSPANLRDFYEPNLVKWDFPLSALPRNASVKEIKALGKRASLHLEELDFNSAYPQDVVIMRTNIVIWDETLKNRIYDAKIPHWGRVYHNRLNAIAWLRLMKPTRELRDSLNTALVAIAEKIQEESLVWKSLRKNLCCKKVPLPPKLQLCSGNATICSKTSSAQECCEKLKDTMFAGCPELRVPCSGIDSKECVNHLSLAFPGRWDIARAETLAHNYCTLPAPTSRLNETIDSIRSKTGYDLTDMNLVCAHIRLGRSKTFPWERWTVSKKEDIAGIWEFLRGYARKGYHMYLASDAQEVKDEARGIFGERLHMTAEEIIHIDHGERYDDPKAGFLFTLMEQLLLATSCHEMVHSHSGFSIRAAELRRALMGDHAAKVYEYRNGMIRLRYHHGSNRS